MTAENSEAAMEGRQALTTLTLVDQPTTERAEDACMADREGERTHRRGSDEEGALVGHFRAADSGVSMFWRWGNMLVTLIGFGVVIGIYYSNFGWMRDQIIEIRADQSASRKENADLKQQVSLDHQEITYLRRDLDAATKANVTLNGKLDEIRGMRESYVYDAARAILRKQPTLPTPP